MWLLSAWMKALAIHRGPPSTPQCTAPNSMPCETFERVKIAQLAMRRRSKRQSLEGFRREKIAGAQSRNRDPEHGRQRHEAQHMPGPGEHECESASEGDERSCHEHRVRPA